MTDNLSDYTDEERRQFQALPKTAIPDRGLEDALVGQLKAEGLIHTRRRPALTVAYLAAAAALVATAWLGGVRSGARASRASSIEGQLERTDLTTAERVLLMQRAGSAYVAAANAYAANTRVTDAAAAEVSSQVLMGAAQAVARTNLDAPLAKRIATLVGESNKSSANIHPVIWY